jgi:beta-glucosidase
MRSFVALAALQSTFFCWAAAEPPAPRPQQRVDAGRSSAPDPRVEQLLAKMTVAEKAGQLGVFARPAGQDFNPGTGGGWNETVELLRNGSIGSLYNGAGVATNLALQRVAVEESRLGIPLIFGADVWHGMHTVFPIPLGEAASWDPGLAERTARATAVEATAAGIQWTYSPMVDVARDQRWGRVAEGAGEDPVLGSAFARARVRGFQGPDLAANDSMAACLKHYAGYGGVAAGLDYSAVDVSEATFRDVFLPPFAAGVAAGALSLMSAFVAIIGGVPASGSRWLQTDVLRGELGFDGFVVSDYEADAELIDHGFAANESDAANKALWAGVDMSMQSGLCAWAQAVAVSDRV